MNPWFLRLRISPYWRKMFLRRISTLTYKFFFDLRTIGGEKRKRKRISIELHVENLTIFIKLSSASMKSSRSIFLIPLKFELSTFDFVYKKIIIILEYLIYFERKPDFTLSFIFLFLSHKFTQSRENFSLIKYKKKFNVLKSN